MASPAPPRERSIALVGMMGSGKTTIGRLLASRLALPFVDLDAEVEAEAGLPIKEIFDRFGEPGFRQLERRVAARVVRGPPCVIAAGGGAFADPEAHALIREHCLTIWLDAEHGLLVERLKADGDRPMLEGGEMPMRLARLLDARRPFYSKADLRVQVRGDPPERTAERVAGAIAAFSVSG